ncbi:hypothetical protein, partial [Micromonospora sp. NPDC047730]|uniref:hypothetical protein n=1 Tax=Micromonospora sp. NPDC047730 TaxID=3364253 RepID=UPI0037218E8C
MDWAAHEYSLAEAGLETPKDLPDWLQPQTGGAGGSLGLPAAPTPAAGPGWSPSGGQKPDWEKEVEAAVRYLTVAGTAAEAAFGEWAREVFEFDPAKVDLRSNYAFNESVLNTYREELGKKGITTPTGLRGWLSRQMAEELALGGSSRFRELLPYPYPDPENMSEQRRDALHRIWLDKIANARSADLEVAPVALHLLAKGLDQPMRIHHPFGDPYDDIGPSSDDGAIPHSVVWWNGGYIILKPRDPNDADIAARIASGYQRNSISDPEQQRRDRLFNEALGLLKTEIATAEGNFTKRHRSLLKYVFDRELAAIGQRPTSPRRQAEELAAHRRYLNALGNGGDWEGDYRWKLNDPFTLRIPAYVHAGSDAYSALRTRLGGKDVELTRVDHMILSGDMVDIDFGSVDGVGVGIVKIPYMANGAMKFAYLEIDRKFTDSELAELRDKAPGQAWQLDEPPVGLFYHIAAGLVPKNGQLSRSFGKGSEGEKLQRAHIPAVKVADGSPFVIPQNMKEVILRLGYGWDGQPLAVVVMPAEKSGAGQDLYLQLLKPAPTIDDIEWLRKASLWERENWWNISRVRYFDDEMDSQRRLPNPLRLTIGRNSAKTLDGREVNLAPGTPITLGVGERLRPVGKDVVNGFVDSVKEVVVVVKAPLVPRRDAPASEPEYAFRLFTTGKTDYDAFIKQLEDRQMRLEDRQMRLGERKRGAESATGRAAQRPRIEDGPGARGGSSSGWGAGEQPPAEEVVGGGWQVSYRSPRDLTQALDLGAAPPGITAPVDSPDLPAGLDLPAPFDLASPPENPALVESLVEQDDPVGGRVEQLDPLSEVSGPAGTRRAPKRPRIGGGSSLPAGAGGAVPGSSETMMAGGFGGVAPDLREVPGQTWEFAPPSFAESYHITASLDPKSNSGQLNVGFAGRPVFISPTVVVDGRSFVFPVDIERVRVELGYDILGRPAAVVELPAENSPTGRALYLKLEPAPTAGDIESLRRRALWVPQNQWDLSDPATFEDTIHSIKRIDRVIPYLPRPLRLRFGSENMTFGGGEVNVTPGTDVTYRVGKWSRQVGPEFVTGVFVVVKAPLVDGTGHAYKIINTRKTVDQFEALIKDLRDRQERRNMRILRAESVPEPTRQRPSAGDGPGAGGGSSLPGGAAAFEWGRVGGGSFSGGGKGVLPSGWA